MIEKTLKLRILDVIKQQLTQMLQRILIFKLENKEQHHNKMGDKYKDKEMIIKLIVMVMGIIIVL